MNALKSIQQEYKETDADGFVVPPLPPFPHPEIFHPPPPPPPPDSGPRTPPSEPDCPMEEDSNDEGEEEEEEDEEDWRMCRVCNVSFTEQAKYRQHCRGMMHTLNATTEKSCKVVTVKTESPVSTDSRAVSVRGVGKKKAKAAARAQAQNSERPAGGPKKLDPPPSPKLKASPAKPRSGNSPHKGRSPESKEEWKHCKLCDIPFDDFKLYQRHCRGMSHTQKALSEQRKRELKDSVKDPKNSDGARKRSMQSEPGNSDYHLKNKEVHARRSKETHATAFIEIKYSRVEDPLIGLKHIDEFVSHDTPPKYYCKLCKVKGNADSILHHISGPKHQIAYLRESNPEWYEEVMYYDNDKESQSDVLLAFGFDVEKIDGRYGLVKQLRWITGNPAQDQAEPIGLQPRMMKPQRSTSFGEEDAGHNNDYPEDSYSTSSDGLETSKFRDRRDEGYMSHPPNVGRRKEHNGRGGYEGGSSSGGFRSRTLLPPPAPSMASGPGPDGTLPPNVVKSMLVSLSQSFIQNEEDAMMAERIITALQDAVRKYRSRSGLLPSPKLMGPDPSINQMNEMIPKRRRPELLPLPGQGPGNPVGPNDGGGPITCEPRRGILPAPFPSANPDRNHGMSGPNLQGPQSDRNYEDQIRTALLSTPSASQNHELEQRMELALRSMETVPPRRAPLLLSGSGDASDEARFMPHQGPGPNRPFPPNNGQLSLRESLLREALMSEPPSGPPQSLEARIENEIKSGHQDSFERNQSEGSMEFNSPNQFETNSQTPERSPSLSSSFGSRNRLYGRSPGWNSSGSSGESPRPRRRSRYLE